MDYINKFLLSVKKYMDNNMDFSALIYWEVAAQPDDQTKIICWKFYVLGAIKRIYVEEHCIKLWLL